jgi:hypothetical protein
MKQKNSYAAPCVLRKISIELEGTILAGSVVDSVSGVKTTGQETGSIYEDVSSSSSSTFNDSWGE